MKRQIDAEFDQWFANPTRKPALIWGARQIGKTYAVRDWASRNFSAVIEINFQERPSWKKAFAGDLDPESILRNIEITIERPINRDGRDILFFDEIQECSEALTSLKYFCETSTGVPVIAAGSLLGVRLAGTPFPVGKVEILHMYPMSFGEFLQAVSSPMSTVFNEALAAPKSLSAIAHEKMWSLFKDYLSIGGLPEVVDVWLQQGGHAGGLRAFNAARVKSEMLFAGYISDIAKYSGRTNAMHIERVWRAIPSQLAGSVDDATQRFRFKDVLPGLKAYRDLAGPIDWLLKAGLVIKRPICHSAATPFAAYTKENIFKLQMFDVGLLGTMAGLSLKTIDSFDFGTYKGFLVENFVAQELLAAHPHRGSVPALHAWSEGQAEIEFLVDSENGPVPVEVKSGTRIRAKSMASYIERWRPKTSLILSARDYAESINDGVRQIRLPLYLAARVWGECFSRASI